MQDQGLKLPSFPVTRLWRTELGVGICELCSWLCHQSHMYLGLHFPSAECSWILQSPQSTKKTSGLVKCTGLEVNWWTCWPSNLGWVRKARSPHLALLPHACLAKGMSGEIRLKPSDLLAEHRKGKLQAASRQECSADPSGSLKGSLKLVGWAIKAHQGIQQVLCSSSLHARLKELLFVWKNLGWRKNCVPNSEGLLIPLYHQCWRSQSLNTCEQPYPRATALSFLNHLSGRQS